MMEVKYRPLHVCTEMGCHEFTDQVWEGRPMCSAHREAELLRQENRRLKAELAKWKEEKGLGKDGDLR